MHMYVLFRSVVYGSNVSLNGDFNWLRLDFNVGTRYVFNLRKYDHISHKYKTEIFKFSLLTTKTPKYRICTFSKNTESLSAEQ